MFLEHLSCLLPKEQESIYLVRRQNKYALHGATSSRDEEDHRESLRGGNAENDIEQYFRAANVKKHQWRKREAYRGSPIHLSSNICTKREPSLPLAERGTEVCGAQKRGGCYRAWGSILSI